MGSRIEMQRFFFSHMDAPSPPASKEPIIEEFEETLEETPAHEEEELEL